MTNGQVILENQSGEVVRTFRLLKDRNFLIQRHDLGRIEVIEDLNDLDSDSYSLIQEFSVSQLQSKSVPISTYGHLKLVPRAGRVSPSVELTEESDEGFKTILKWTAAAHLILLLLIWVSHQLISRSVPDEEETLVKIVEPQNTKIKPFVPTVNVSSHKIKRRHKAQKVTHRKVKPKRHFKKVVKRKIKARRHRVKVAAKSRSNLKSKKHSPVTLNQVGALGVLGSLNRKGQRQGGLDLNRMKTSAGAGKGGLGGSGGMQTTMYGKGLVNHPLGPGRKAHGAGGYGTRGKGGGQAGYGRISLAGSSNAYFQPLEDQASVMGGLDRDQVAAVIRRHIGQIVYCYESGLQVQPKLKGRVSVRFNINPHGTVNMAKVAHTSLRSSRVESCIVKRLRSWKFPRPVGQVNVKVTYPFVLRRVSQG